MAPIKTDNSYLADKVELRAAHLPAGDQIRVLDCYAGAGRIWDYVRRSTGRRIDVVPIDVEAKQEVVLLGDNVKWMMGIDLAKYQVVDLDAYGMLTAQLLILFDKRYHGTVFITFIQSLFGQLSRQMLRELGYTNRMIEKIPALFNRQGFEKFKDWLSVHGVKRICHRSTGKKHYLVVEL